MIRIDNAGQAGPSLGDLRRMLRTVQSDLAARAGFDQSLVSKWERGHSVPTVDSLIRTAHALGYDLALVPREDA
ncbi:helix-turn-helix domain-containing protein [Krasilnikovia sp. MM14-A1259]|uniref:helix-turn-helix domain-containing protein n=1 Tax=Krasilnikovia sp. MM14-A1259 TaxID=3373539 RepID=UPI003822BF68